jgi:TolA-binding protein
MSEVEWNERELDALLDSAAAAMAADGRPRDGDDALIARSVAGALARAGAGDLPEVARRVPSTRRGLLLAAATLVVATGAFALVRARKTPETAGLPASTEAVATRPAAAPQTVVPLAEGAPDIATAEEPAGAPRTTLPAAAVPELGPRELFAQANETRRQGEAAGAARQYVALEKRYPRSPEAKLSLVALGRLYLDRLADPGRALAQFDRYMAASDGGELREEAMVGRALALQRLGRTTDEKAAWQALLAAFPGSLSADRANARLTELH